MRQLKAEEVIFVETVKDEFELPDELYRNDEEDIRSRLARGDNSAWCILVVQAQWEEFSGDASLGGFTFPEGNTGEQNQEYAKKEFEALRVDALEDLNGNLRYIVEKLAKLD